MPKKLTKCLIRAVLVAGLIKAVTASSVPERSDEASTQVEAFADDQLAEYVRKSPGASLAVVIVKDGRVLLEKGYGTEGDDGRQRVDPRETVFQIASVSKVLTTIAVMQQVEHGRLSLDVPIATYLPDLRFDRQAIPPVTLRTLLTHTSGLDGPFMRDVVARPTELLPLATYFRRFTPTQARPPGAEIRYSNYGMALAGHLVEIASGQPFAEYVEQRVFHPAGMTSSSFRQPPPAPVHARVATSGSGPVPDALLPFPSGAAVSTVHDMSRLLELHLNNGQVDGAVVLRPETMRLMHASQWRADPRVPGVALGLFETELGGIRGLFHTGARIHFSLFYVAPEHRLGIFLVHSMRQGGPFQDLRTTFVRAFVTTFVDKAPPATAALKHGTLASDRHAGVYRPVLLSQSNIERAAWMALDTRVISRTDGALTIAIPGGRTLTAVPVADDLYEVQGGAEDGMRVAFAEATPCCGVRMSLSGATQDPVSFDRLSWFERGFWHAVTLSLILLLFTGCLIWTATVAAIAKVRRSSTRTSTSTDTRGARLAWGVAALMGVGSLMAPLSVAAIVLLHDGDDVAAGNLRFGLTVGLSWLLVVAALGTSLPVLAVRAWRLGYWSVPRRLYFTAMAAGVIVAIPLLHYHRLLGYFISW